MYYNVQAKYNMIYLYSLHYIHILNTEVKTINLIGVNY